MPSTTILPNFSIDHVLEAWWPRPERNALFGALNTVGVSKYQLGAGGFAPMMGVTGTVQGVVYPPAAGGAGIYGAHVGNQAVGLSTLALEEQYACYQGGLRAADFPTGALINNEVNRVNRWTWWMAVTGAGLAAATDATAAFFAPAAGLGPGLPTAGNPGFGLVMNGAGALQYRNYQAGAFPGNIAETVALPAGTITDVTAWNFFDVEIIGAAPGRDASMSLVVNGVDIVSRNWVSGGGAELADFADATGGLGSSIQGPIWFTDNNTDPNVGIRVASVRVTKGRWTRGGLEVLF